MEFSKSYKRNLMKFWVFSEIIGHFFETMIKFPNSADKFPKIKFKLN